MFRSVGKCANRLPASLTEFCTSYSPVVEINGTFETIEIAIAAAADFEISDDPIAAARAVIDSGSAKDDCGDAEAVESLVDDGVFTGADGLLRGEAANGGFAVTAEAASVITKASAESATRRDTGAVPLNIERIAF
jgi:hypothetical protein